MSTIQSSTEHLTLNADGASKDIKFQANGVEVSSISSAGVMTATSFAGDGSALTGVDGGKVLQVVDVHNGSVSTFTASIPFDDTIPQITEGTEIMTLSITPTSTTSKLFIQAGVFATPSANNMIITTCLFEGTTSNALSAIYWRDSLAGFGDIAQLNHTMVSGSTSIKTFRIRMGIDSGSSTTTVNGHGGGRRYGGVISSFIRITEYEV